MSAKKKCIDCGKTKPVGDFYRVHKDGEHRQSRCKPCDNKCRSYGTRASVAGRGRGPDRKPRVGSKGVDVTRRADGTLVIMVRQ